MKDDPLPILLGFIVISLLLTPATCSKMEHTGTIAEYATVQDSAFIAQSPHYVEKFVTLASLVDCLCWEETKYDADAINWNDWHLTIDGNWEQGSFGCLQYSKSTFQEYCVDKYNLEDNIFNCSVQRKCAVKMLEENKGHRWTTYNKCL